MRKKIFLTAALLLLLISICAVSAEDINQTDDNCDTVSANGTETKSFSDLSNDLMSSTGEFNIQTDYKFNSSTDGNFKEGIKINFTSFKLFTINGNNHVIDADNQAGIFKFFNGNVTINNLKIINANTSSIIIGNCELHTNNVTFKDNHDDSEAGAIYAEGSRYLSSHDRFINNYALKGASIYAVESGIEIDNSTFINNKPVHWSVIYGSDSVILVNNTFFRNLTSRYATAIYSEKNKLYVLNSKFINLFANATAGAIGCKMIDKLIISGCSFINVSSAKNAGAVYVDINGKFINTNSTATIADSSFENCSSGFAGAYLQLGGILDLNDCNFTDNTAEYCGGAVYLSNTTNWIIDCKFNKNTAKQLYGGALYIDDSASAINRGIFLDNYAGTFGDAVYLYDSRYIIENSQFSKGSKECIVSFFDRKNSVLNKNELNGGKTLLNQTSYNTIVSYEGKKIILNVTSTADASVNDKRFDLRDYTVNGVSLAGVVKDQGSNGACWAFGATGALESAFLKATGILLDLSENKIQGSSLYYSEYGSDEIFEGGYVTSAMGLFLSWLSVISQEYDTYDELGKISIASYVPNESFHIQDAIIIPKRTNALDNTKLKDALIKYGGLTVHYYSDTSPNYYNPTTHAQYYNGTEHGNHIVTLVGWDDNYSRNNFATTPAGDGAWICKNSWGTEWGEAGYFYISYYDTSFAMSSPSVGYIINNTESYTTLYQYDIGDVDYYFTDKGEIINFINIYEAEGNELIKAVGTYFSNAGEDYTIDIYIGEDIVYTQSGKSTHGGFETIKLDKKIAIHQGQEFSIGIKAKAMPLLENTRIHFQKEKSIAHYTDGIMEDIGASNKTICVKAYTVSNPNPEINTSQYYTYKNLTINANTNAKQMSIYQENKLLGSAAVSEGKAQFNFTLNPGNYTLITSYDDGDVVEGYEVKDSIEIPDYIKIGYNTRLTIDAKFYDENGVELKYENVTFQFNGKTYTGLIDNNDGILYLTLSDLSMGKHSLILKNPKTLQEIKTTIEVVSRFSGNSNVKMFYADGSSFKVRVYDNYGKAVGANQIVSVKLNKVTYNVKTNSKGYAIFSIPNTVKVGSHTLTATYAGQTIKNTVKVKQVLKLSKVKVKKSAKKLVIKATLKGKTVIKNKKLTFKFNGKKYSAKTNKKGIAKITVKKSVLKKLKVGKKVKYQVTYIKNTVKQSVKVKK